MDYRKTYNEFRNGMIKAIINNADTINSKFTTRKLGYIMCGEPDENYYAIEELTTETLIDLCEKI